MLAALSAAAVIFGGVQAALFLDPEVPLAPASWAIISVCIWLLFVLSKGGWSQLSRNDIRRFAFGIFAAVSFLHFLQLDSSFKGWSSVYYFCGNKLQYCTCSFRWNFQGWMKAAVLWQFVLSATLGAQQLIIQAGLGGLLPGEEAVTRESFVSIGWRLIPYWLNNWEQQWGAEVSSMTFELPHFAVELLIILPCCQIICSRLKVLVTPQVNVLLGPGGADEGPFVREDFAPNVLQGFWERRPEQRKFLPRVRSNLRVLAFLTGLTALAALNATLVPLYLEGQAAGAEATPAVALIGRNTDWLDPRVGELSVAGEVAMAAAAATGAVNVTGGGGSTVAWAIMAGAERAEWVGLLEAARQRYGLYGARECGDREQYARSVAKHATELQRMQDPEHRALIPLVESALAIMRLSCEKYFVLVAIYVAFLLFRDAPRPARAVIRVVARVSGIFQKVILFAFPAVCWLYNAGLIFSLFVSVVFWGGPLLALYDTARSALREVSIRALAPATSEQVHRMGGSCAICWGDMTAQGAPAARGHVAAPSPSTAIAAAAAATEAEAQALAAAEAEAAASVAGSASAASFDSALADWDVPPPGEASVPDDAAGAGTRAGAAGAAAATAAADPGGRAGGDEPPQSSRRQRRQQKRTQEDRQLKQQQRKRGDAEEPGDADASCSTMGQCRTPSASSSCCSGLSAYVTHAGGPAAAGGVGVDACRSGNVSCSSAGGVGTPGEMAPPGAGATGPCFTGCGVAAATAVGPPDAAPPRSPNGAGAGDAAPAVAAGEAAAAAEAGEGVAAANAAAAAAAAAAHEAAAAAAATAAEAEAKAVGWALPCGHAYHHECLLQWMEQCSSTGVTPTCPMCQRGIQLQVRWRLPPFLRRRGGAAGPGEAPGAAGVGGGHGTARLLGLGGGAGGAAAAAAVAAAAAAGGGGGGAAAAAAAAAGGAAAAAELAAGAELLDAVRNFAGADAGLQVVGLLEHQRELQELLHEAPALEFGEMLREAQPLIVQQAQAQVQAEADAQQQQQLAQQQQQPGQAGWEGGAQEPGLAGPELGEGGGGMRPVPEPHWLQLNEQPPAVEAMCDTDGRDSGSGSAGRVVEQQQQCQQQSGAAVAAALAASGYRPAASGAEGESRLTLAVGQGADGRASGNGGPSPEPMAVVAAAAAAGRTGNSSGGGGSSAAQQLPCNAVRTELSGMAPWGSAPPGFQAYGPVRNNVAPRSPAGAAPARAVAGESRSSSPEGGGGSGSNAWVKDGPTRGAAGPPGAAARTDAAGDACSGERGAKLSLGSGVGLPTPREPVCCGGNGGLEPPPSSLLLERSSGHGAASGGSEGAGPSGTTATAGAVSVAATTAAVAPAAEERRHKPRRRLLFWRRKHTQ